MTLSGFWAVHLGRPLLHASRVAFWAHFLRGLATWEEGQPDYTPRSRFILSGQQGVTVGTYPLDRHRSYFFCGFKVTPVCLACFPPGAPSCSLRLCLAGPLMHACKH